MYQQDRRDNALCPHETSREDARRRVMEQGICAQSRVVVVSRTTIARARLFSLTKSTVANVPSERLNAVRSEIWSKNLLESDWGRIAVTDARITGDVRPGQEIAWLRRGLSCFAKNGG